LRPAVRHTTITGLRSTFDIFEILLILVVALIVIPPDQLPTVMQTVGKVLRELRSASNELMREITDSIEERPAKPLPSAGTTLPPPNPPDQLPEQEPKP
jgi:Sec-independent protein translocase protein TatA